MATAFLLRLDRHRYRELIMFLKNDYAKKNYPKILIDMYMLMLAFDPMRVTLVSGGRN